MFEAAYAAHFEPAATENKRFEVHECCKLSFLNLSLFHCKLAAPPRELENHISATTIAPARTLNKINAVETFLKTFWA